MIVFAVGCGGGGGAQSASIPAPGAALPTVPGAPSAPGALPPSPAPSHSPAATPTPSPTPATPQVAQYAAPNQITSIAVGADGNVWFTETQQTVGKLNVASGSVSSYNGVPASQANCTVPNVPPSQSSSGTPLKFAPILAVPGGTLWYGISCGGALMYGYSGFDAITTSGSVTAGNDQVYNPPEVMGAAVGSDGNVWATEYGINGTFVAGWSTSTMTAVKNCDHPVPAVSPGIASGSDGALWMTSGGTLLRMTTSCAFTTFAAPAGTTFDGRSIASTTGALWVIDMAHNAIDKFTTTGTETTYPVLNSWVADAQGNVGYVTASPSGAYVYFDDSASAQIGRINVSTGQVQEFSLPAGSTPQALAADAAGNLWTFSGATVLKVTFPG